MKILVIGATGTVGSHVVPGLQAKGHTVRAMTRSSATAKAAPEGIEVRVGDLSDPMALGVAFDGIEAVFLLNAMSPSETQEGLTALEWAKRARVVKIVYMSAQSCDEAPHVPHFGSKTAIERAIRKSGIDYTILQPASFFQNDYRYKEALLKYGLYPEPFGEKGVNRVDVRDIADAAVNAFTDPWASDGTFVVANGEVMTSTQIASAYAHAFASGVAAVTDLDTWEQQALEMLPDWLVFDLRMMYEWMQAHGMTANRADIERTERLMGHSPRSYTAFVDEAVRAWRT